MQPKGPFSSQKLGLFLVSVSLVAAACGGQGAATASRASTAKSSLPSFTQASPINPGTTVVAGRTHTVPTERPGVGIAPGTDTGGQIIVSTSGVLPLHLFANLNETVTWTNLTSKTISLRFLFSRVRSGPIPPGGTFRFRSSTLYTFNYITSNGFRGEVAIGAFAN